MVRLLAGLLLVLGLSGLAGAEEYRLQVASLRAVKVIAEIRPAESSRRCDEVVWQGVPGERSVWVIGPATTRTQGTPFGADPARLYEDRGPALAATGGESSNPTFADWVYLVIQHPPRPSTFKAVVGWERRRGADRSNLDGATLRE